MGVAVPTPDLPLEKNTLGAVFFPWGRNIPVVDVLYPMDGKKR